LHRLGAPEVEARQFAVAAAAGVRSTEHAEALARRVDLPDRRDSIRHQSGQSAARARAATSRRLASARLEHRFDPRHEVAPPACQRFELQVRMRTDEAGQQAQVRFGAPDAAQAHDASRAIPADLAGRQVALGVEHDAARGDAAAAGAASTHVCAMMRSARTMQFGACWLLKSSMKRTPVAASR
jgi:hypothetical protein